MRCFLCKKEDLSSDPRHSRKTQTWRHTPVPTALRACASWGGHAEAVNTRCKKETCVRDKGKMEKDTKHQFPASLWVGLSAHIHAHKLSNIHTPYHTHYTIPHTQTHITHIHTQTHIYYIHKQHTQTHKRTYGHTYVHNFPWKLKPKKKFNLSPQGSGICVEEEGRI